MIKEPRILLAIALLLSGCVTTQNYAAAPPSLSQIQGQCFTNFEDFLDQTACIQNIVKRVSHNGLNPYAQEYMANMQSLNKKVKSGSISGEDARVQLAQKLTALKQLQNNEFATQEQLRLQRNAQSMEILKQNQPKSPELYDITPHLPKQVNTNCNVYGNQVNCTTY